MEIKRFLIDTDILIDYLRGIKESRDFLVNLKNQRRLLISVVNVVEIYSGRDIKDIAKREVIEEFLTDFEIIPLDENIAKLAGEIRLDYQIPFADAIISATALSSGAILITRNIKHFSQIKNLQIELPKIDAFKDKKATKRDGR